jgi:hypothetical protein
MKFIFGVPFFNYLSLTSNMSSSSYPMESIRSDDKIESLLKHCEEVFVQKFGEKATHAAVAPGRVNLIGEHVDYCDGFVMPMVSFLFENKLTVTSQFCGPFF